MNRREFIKLTGRSALLAASTPLIFSCMKPGVNMPVSPALPEIADWGVSEADLAAVLGRALASGGDFADLYFEQSASFSLSLEEDLVKRADHNVDLGCGVRTVQGDSSGYSFTEQIDRPSLMTCADAAANIAAGKGGQVASSFHQPQYKNYYLLQRPAEGVAIKEKLALLEYANRVAHNESSLVKKIDISYFDSYKKVLVVTAEGKIARDVRPMIGLRCRVIVESKGRRESGYAAFAARSGLEAMTKKTIKTVATRAVNYALDNLQAVTPPAGMLPVILGPAESGVLLHEAIGHGLEADYNRKKSSKYSDKMGQMVASAFCTVIDDGTIANDRGALNVDDEGNASEKTVLIDKGILKSYLHDRISAKHYNVMPTGNGRRQSFRHLPMPRMRVTYLTAGQEDPQDILRSTKHGIYAESFGGGQVNLGPGDFTFQVSRGFMIENGKKTAPIKDVTLIGNGPEVLGKVDMVGHDFKLSQTGWTCGKNGQWVPVGVGQPTVKISSMTVGGRKI